MAPLANATPIAKLTIASRNGRIIFHFPTLEEQAAQLAAMPGPHHSDCSAFARLRNWRFNRNLGRLAKMADKYPRYAAELAQPAKPAETARAARNSKVQGNDDRRQFIN
jgi:hypothetical protein